MAPEGQVAPAEKETKKAKEISKVLILGGDLEKTFFTISGNDSLSSFDNQFA